MPSLGQFSNAQVGLCFLLDKRHNRVGHSPATRSANDNAVHVLDWLTVSGWRGASHLAWCGLLARCNKHTQSALNFLLSQLLRYQAILLRALLSVILPLMHISLNKSARVMSVCLAHLSCAGRVPGELYAKHSSHAHTLHGQWGLWTSFPIFI
eukprot:scaffold204658_cov19-Prasinocladus_malaysianus.AAC.1